MPSTSKSIQQPNCVPGVVGANAGKARILDSVREVVALHKERFVFPVRIAVTRVSGAGADSIFMGVLKQLTQVGVKSVRMSAYMPCIPCTGTPAPHCLPQRLKWRADANSHYAPLRMQIKRVRPAAAASTPPDLVLSAPLHGNGIVASSSGRADVLHLWMPY